MDQLENLADKRVLIIDSSPEIRYFLGSLLQQRGAAVDEASGGAEGLARWSDEGDYGLILLGLALPDMGGIQVLERIREQDQDAAVVVVAGQGGTHSAVEAVRQGADGYVLMQDVAVGGSVTEFYYALEQALRHRAGNIAQQRLQSLKAEFYAKVTHDLRSPAGTLLTAIDMLHHYSELPLSERQERLLSIARSAADKLVHLINDYLDYAKINAGFMQLEIEPTDLGAIVEGSAQLAALEAERREQTMELLLPPEPLIAAVDPGRIEQVVGNLLSNALKYTPKNGCIQVRLGRDGDRALLEVRDNGAGVTPDQAQAIFETYHRQPGETSRLVRGTGLGLPVVKEIVEAHGGTVEVQSTGVPGEGSLFRVYLPLATPPAG